MTDRSSQRPGFFILLVIAGLGLALGLLGCSNKAKESAKSDAQNAPPVSSPSAPLSTADDPGASSNAVGLPMNFAKRTGDLDEMVKHRSIRALVMMNPIGFFYERGIPKGALYESLEELQKFANKKLKTGKLRVKVTFVPVTPEQVEAALLEGMGDFVANPVVITPERAKRFAFSIPVVPNVTQIVVSNPDFGTLLSVDDLAGKEIYVNPLAASYANLQKNSERLQQSGKAAINIQAADKNLNEDDLIQMVHARLIPATVTTSARAELWSKVFDDVKSQPNVVIADKVDMAMVMRRGNPQLKQLLDEFATTHRAGTTFGNTLLKRYVSTKWVKNSTSEPEMEKFRATVDLFKKYATQYDFDFLMLVAQGYQESMLDQKRRSAAGAVGIMQVIPKYAAADPIKIRNVEQVDANIHAGAKMLRHIAETYFDDPQIDPVNRTLMAFASYNAGPTRIARLRKKAATMGLNPNIWFGNVEQVVAHEVGQETVTYVGNIYKYYVAYKLALEQSQRRQKARAIASK